MCNDTLRRTGRARPESADDGGGPIPPEHRPTKAQAEQIKLLLAQLAEADPYVDWAARAREIAVVRPEMLTRTTIRYVIEKLEAELSERSAA